MSRDSTLKSGVPKCQELVYKSNKTNILCRARIAMLGERASYSNIITVVLGDN